jgi:hypothetical protein
VEHVPQPPKRGGPLQVPCFACADGLPVDREALIEGIDDMDDHDIAQVLAVIDRRATALALAPVAVPEIRTPARAPRPRRRFGG